MANWPGLDPSDPGDAEPEDAAPTWRPASPTSPARPSRRSRSPARSRRALVTPKTTFDLPPTIQVADRDDRGVARARGYVTLSVADILAQSSNVGAVKIGLELGARDDASTSGSASSASASRPGSSSPARSRGSCPDLDEYSGSTMGNLPIGQGLSVTPMQMAAAYAAIANGGILRTPRLVLERATASRVDPDAGDAGDQPQRTRPRSARCSRACSRPGGTASEVEVPGYTLAGKTGTAQKVDRDGDYSETEFVASFVGFAPAEDPQLLVTVVVDNPKGELLRRHRRRARLRRDRQLRAAVPGHRPGPGRSLAS